MAANTPENRCVRTLHCTEYGDYRKFVINYDDDVGIKRYCQFCAAKEQVNRRPVNQKYENKGNSARRIHLVVFVYIDVIFMLLFNRFSSKNDNENSIFV